MYDDIHYALAAIRIDELRREAREDRLSGQLPPQTRPAWRSAIARQIRAFADWLEPAQLLTPRLSSGR